MFFPEELDNKPFRLFVQRTWHLSHKNVVLSPTEKELSDLIAEHPEAGLFFINGHLDDKIKNSSHEYNPYLYLSALWEIYKQMKSDRPKGIRKLAEKLFPKELSEAEVRSYLAAAYLVLFQQEKQGAGVFDGDKYLLELENIVQDDLDEAKKDNDNQKTGYNPYYYSLIDQALSSLKSVIHEEASSKPISLNLTLAAGLNRLPLEWVKAVAQHWKRPYARLKRDYINDLESFLTSESVKLLLSTSLSEMEGKALKMILENDGYITYNRLVKAFDGEHNDDYYWTQNPPNSVIGRLRYKGLLFVGRIQKKSRRYKIAVIPQELVPVLKDL